MYLINKQNIVFAEIREKRDKIAALFDSRSRRHTDVYPHLVCDYRGKRGLAQTGRTVEQDMVKHLSPCLCRVDVDF